jgi:transcriptional regulator with XRE-family HTH domain
MSVGQRIKILIGELKISKSAMARVLNISHTAVANLITEQSNPTINTLVPLMKTYNVNANWLILGEGNMFSDVQNSILSERELELMASLTKCNKRNEHLQDKIIELENQIKDYGHSRKKHSTAN